MKLFVWEGFCPDYTDGLAFAIAKSEDDAKKMIEKELGYPVSVWGSLAIHPLNKPFCASVHGGG